MKKLNKFISSHKKDLIIGFILFTSYFFSRIYKLIDFPIFNDEAIYIRWAQLAKEDASLRFISLTDGKQPLYIWLTMIVIPFIKDPLLSGRLVSVFTGFFSMIGVSLLSFELFKKRSIAYLTVFFYLIFPLAVILNRLALLDSLLASLYLWSLYIAILLVKKTRPSFVFILSYLLGASALTKTTGFFSFYLVPLCAILIKKLTKNVFKIIFFLTCALILANIYYSVLKLSPDFHIIAEKNQIFVFPLRELNLRQIISNLTTNALFASWLITYLGIFPLVISLASFFIRKEFLKEKILLFFWFLIPFIFTIMAGKILYSRYLLFLSLSLLPLLAYSFYYLFKILYLKHKLVSYLYIFTVIFYPLYFSLFIVFDINKAPFPQNDMFQYLNGWPAGGGIKETVNFIGNLAKTQSIIAISEEKYGSLVQTSLEIYFNKNKNVTLYPLDTLTDKVPEQILMQSKSNQIYLITNKFQDKPLWPVKLVKEYQKGQGGYYLRIWKVSH